MMKLAHMPDSKSGFYRFKSDFGYYAGVSELEQEPALEAGSLTTYGFESHHRYCGCGRNGYAPDCGSGLCGSESRRSHYALYKK